MKMLRRMIGLLALVALLALPTVSFAQSSAQEEARGSGVLHATGDGVATLHGDADYINLSGDGILYIVDRAGDARIHVIGDGIRREVEWGGEMLIAYQGFNGRAEISGSDVLVRVVGENIVLDAAGSGRVMLQGEGQFSLSRADGSHREGHWRQEPTTFEMAES